MRRFFLFERYVAHAAGGGSLIASIASISRSAWANGSPSCRVPCTSASAASRVSVPACTASSSSSSACSSRQVARCAYRFCSSRACAASRMALRSAACYSSSAMASPYSVCPRCLRPSDGQSIARRSAAWDSAISMRYRISRTRVQPRNPSRLSSNAWRLSLS